jgi:hypothetical protein
MEAQLTELVAEMRRLKLNERGYDQRMSRTKDSYGSCARTVRSTTST